MPGMYPEGEYDLAGFCVGVVEKDRILDGKSIKPGDAILGLASSGAHSNGYSLIRRIIENDKPNSDTVDALMEPTRIYVKSVLKLLSAAPVKGLAHITGGGIVGNVPRILPLGTNAVIYKAAWPRPQLFSWLQEAGNVAEDEMFRVFNCGIGMVIVVAREHVQLATMLLKREGELVYEIGAIEESGATEPEALIV
jgi:phosphoribosylformylglycinamidine cyclo-ligase